jgi:predicted DsbA family dithiol-disulfide isomerase
VASLAHRMAIESPRVTADVVEASEFPSMSQMYAVRGVPKTVVNERTEILGARPEARFVAEVLAAVE